VGAVLERDPHALAAADGVKCLGEVTAGLLVLELADEEDRDACALEPRSWRALAEDARIAERRALLQGERVLRLQTQQLVARAVLVAAAHQLARVGLAAVGCGLGVALTLLHPALREPRVEDPARVAGAFVEVIGHRQRRDRGEVRRTGTGHEQLADARERDPDHADLAALDPRLGGHGLDRVVAVVGGGQIEEVEVAARAAGAAHLHADGGEAKERRDHRSDRRRRGRGERVVHPAGATGQRAGQRAEQVVRRCHLVAGVLDHGREGTVGERLAGRETDGHRELDAVAHAHVVETLVQADPPVEGRRRVVAGTQYAQRHRARRAPWSANYAIAPWREFAEDEAAEVVGPPLPHDATAAVEKAQLLAAASTYHVGVAHPAARREGHLRRRFERSTVTGRGTRTPERHARNWKLGERRSTGDREHRSSEDDPARPRCADSDASRGCPPPLPHLRRRCEAARSPLTPPSYCVAVHAQPNLTPDRSRCKCGE